MEKTRLTLHFVDHDSRIRAELSHMAFGLGHHAEVYAAIGELAAHQPRSGVVIVRDHRSIGLMEGGQESEGGIAALIAHLAEAGVWLPLIAMSHEPAVDRIVQAMKAGALDYLSFPLERSRLVESLARVAKEAEAHAQARRRMVDARSRISRLSQREREVLDWLAEGSSNKAIARVLDISPRTVEIHRANMLDKLGARHSVEAVRLRLDAGIEEPSKGEVA